MEAVPAQHDADTRTRERLMAVAVDLFGRHSYAGTSLQMIADDLGFTKGAIYHHFRTREDLLWAIVGPILDQLRAVVEAAERHRSARARAEHMLTGYAAHLAANRSLAGVLALDPGVLEVLRADPDTADLIDRQIRLLAGVEPGPSGRIKATMVMAGVAAAADPRTVRIDEDALTELLVESGRRTLGLRARARRG
jgi:AcrR family transcriptional regulator